jgi:hypothetical protein
MAGPAAMVGTMEDPGTLRSDWEAGWIDSYDGEVYLEGGLGESSGRKEGLSFVHYPGNIFEQHNFFFHSAGIIRNHFCVTQFREGSITGA